MFQKLCFIAEMLYYRSVHLLLEIWYSSSGLLLYINNIYYNFYLNIEYCIHDLFLRLSLLKLANFLLAFLFKRPPPNPLGTHIEFKAYWLWLSGTSCLARCKSN